MKPNPASSMQRATPLGPTSSLAPSASRTSAEPERLVAERLPCLATAQPAPAATSAAVVDTLKVLRPPPVPAVSSRSPRCERTGVASARIVAARPAISSTVSPFVRRAMRKAEISTSVALPAMISASTSPACAWLRSRPDASASMAAVRTGFGIRWRRRLVRGEEVAQHVLAALGEHRLGVELHALDGQLAMPQAHEHATAPGRDGQLGREVVLGDDER